MKEYYTTKLNRNRYILEALDVKISEDLKATADLVSGPGALFIIKGKADELAETRALITDEIQYLEEVIAKLEEEAKASSEEAE